MVVGNKYSGGDGVFFAFDNSDWFFVVSGEKGFSEEALLEVGWLDGCVRIFSELCPNLRPLPIHRMKRGQDRWGRPEINRSVFFGVVLYPEITSKP